MRKKLFTSILLLVVIISYSSCSSDDLDDIGGGNNSWGEYTGTIRFIDKSNTSSNSSVILNEFNTYTNESTWESAIATITLKRNNDSILTMQCTSSIKTFSETLVYKLDEEDNIICKFDYGSLSLKEGELSYKWNRSNVGGSGYHGVYFYDIKAITITAFHDTKVSNETK